MNSVEEAHVLAALAGIGLSNEREARFAAGLEGIRRIVQTLSRRDYGEIEPAGQFRPPRRATR